MTRSMLRRLASAVPFLILLAIYLGTRGGSAEPSPAPVTPAAATETPIGGAPVSRPDLGFRSPQQLAEHHAKHAAEFGGISEAEYLYRAQSLRDRPAEGDILELTRADGVITRFDRATGDFLAANPDGTIRTLFRPNTGEAYFRRQAQRSNTQ